MNSPFTQIRFKKTNLKKNHTQIQERYFLKPWRGRGVKGWEKWNKVLHFLFQSSIWMELCSPTITKESLSAIIIIVTNHIFSRMLCQKNSSLSLFSISISIYLSYMGKKIHLPFGQIFLLNLGWFWPFYVDFSHCASFLAIQRRQPVICTMYIYMYVNIYIYINWMSIYKYI